MSDRPITNREFFVACADELCTYARTAFLEHMQGVRELLLLMPIKGNRDDLNAGSGLEENMRRFFMEEAVSVVEKGQMKGGRKMETAADALALVNYLHEHWAATANAHVSGILRTAKIAPEPAQTAAMERGKAEHGGQFRAVLGIFAERLIERRRQNLLPQRAP